MFFHSVDETIENKIAGGEYSVTLKSRSAAHGYRDGGRTHLAHSAFAVLLSLVSSDARRNASASDFLVPKGMETQSSVNSGLFAVAQYPWSATGS